MAVNIDNLEKLKLDSEFSLVHSMDLAQIERLTDDYEMLKSKMIREIHDISDRLDFLYAKVREMKKPA